MGSETIGSGEIQLAWSLVAFGLAIVVYEVLSRLARYAAGRPSLELLIRGLRVPATTLLLGMGLGELALYVAPYLPPELTSYFSQHAIYLVTTLVVLYLLIRVLTNVLANVVALKPINIRVLRLVNAGLYLLMILIAVRMTATSPILPAIGPNEWRIINLITGIVVIYVMSAIVNLVLHRITLERERASPSTVTAYSFLRRLVGAGVWILGILALLLVLVPELLGLVTSVLIAAGFLSIVVGLAAQSTLSNLISGLMIAITQPFRIGDAVMFRNEFCFVEEIKLFHAVLRTWDNRRMMVPNSIFQSEVVINYTTIDPTMLVPVFVDISYESDVDKAMQIMKELAEHHPDFLPTPGLPVVQIMELGESGIRLRLLTRAKDQPTAFKMSKELLYEIKKEFDRQGIEIPYPRRYVILDNRRRRRRRS